MRKVSNKRVLRHIALQMIKENRLKNIAIILAIILTTTMFTTVFSVAASMLTTIEQSTMRQVGGSSMAGLKYGRLEDYETLKKDSKVKDISYRVFVGFLANEEVRDVQSEVYYTQPENAKDSFSYPTIGHLPKDANEVAMSSIILDELGIEASIGATVPLEIMVGNEKYQKEFTLCGYWEGDPVMHAQMVYVSKECQNEMAPEPNISFYDPEADYSMAGYYSIDFDFASKIDIEGQVRALLARNGYDPDTYRYGVNWAYATSRIDVTSTMLVLSILFMIFIAGYLIIYNIFYIGVIASIHQFGLLKTVGTTKRQIKKIIRIQGIIYAGIGMPLGLFIGTVVARRVFPMLVEQMAVSESAITFSVNPLIYVTSILFVLATVFIGCSKPGKIAGRISPVEATKYEDIILSKRKKQRTKKVSVLYLALQNLRRERKKVITVVLSLVISVLLVNGIVSVTKSLDQDLYVSGSIIGDYNLSDGAFQNIMLGVDNTTVVTPEEIAAIKDIAGVKAVDNVYADVSCYIDLDAEGVNRLKDILNGNEDSIYAEGVQYCIDEKYVNMTYYGVDDALLDYITVKEGNIDLEKWKSGEYCLAYIYDLISEEEGLDLVGIGDEITINILGDRTKTYKVLAIGNMPYALSTKFSTAVGGHVIVPTASYLEEESLGALVSVLTIDESVQESVDAEIQNLVKKYPHLTAVSKKTFLEEFNSMINTIRIVGFGLSAILAIIGIINYCNTMITSIYKRSKEFAIMQAVGLTNKQLKIMLITEGALYGLLTMLLALVIHLLIGEQMIELLAGEMWMFKYQPSVLPICVCLPFILLFAIVIPIIVGNEMRHMSIVERIQQN